MFDEVRALAQGLFRKAPISNIERKATEDWDIVAGFNDTHHLANPNCAPDGGNHAVLAFESFSGFDSLGADRGDPTAIFIVHLPVPKTRLKPVLLGKAEESNRLRADVSEAPGVA